MSGENPKVVKPAAEQEPRPKFDDLLKEISPSAEPIKKEPIEPKPEAVQVKANPEPIEKVEPVIKEKPIEVKPVEVVETKPTPEPIKKEEPVITEKPDIGEKPKVEPELKSEVQDPSHLPEDQEKRLKNQLSEVIKQSEKATDDQKALGSIEDEVFGKR